MKLFQIKSKGLALMQGQPYIAPKSLYAKILWHYHLKLQQKFAELFSSYREKSYLFTQLEVILNDNWRLTKDSALAYTCLPNHPITNLMLGIALYLHKELPHRHVNVVKLLMPEVEFESISDNYPDLNQPAYQTEEGIKRILRTHILSDHANYLIPIKILHELSPDNPSFQLMNPYFNYSDMPETQAYISESELERLFEHSTNTKSIQRRLSKYQCLLNGNDHLLGQLRALCRGLNLGSRYGEGSELQAGGSAYASIIEFISFYNQLFSKKFYQLAILPEYTSEFMNSFLWINHESLYYCNESGMTLIEGANSAPFNQVLAKLQEKYRPTDDGMLLTPQELFYLIEKNTGFPTLDKRISSYLQDAILRLIDLASDSGLNLAATATTETCVATIRQSLLTHISSSEDVLAGFSRDLRGSSKLDRKRSKFREQQAELLTLINTNLYRLGGDGLENYGKLLETFAIHYEIDSVSQLSQLFKLKSKNLRSIFANDDLRCESIILFHDIDDVILFLLDCPVDKLECFIDIFAQELKLFFFKDINDLLKIFVLMEPERIAKILNPIAVSYLCSPSEIIMLGNHLSLNAFQMICHTQKSYIDEIITATDYLHICAALNSPSKKEFWLDGFFNSFKRDLATINLFHQATAYLSIAQQDLVFEENKLKLLDDIHHSREFNLLFAATNEAKHAWILEKTLDQLPELAVDSDDINNILSVVPPHFFIDCCHKLRTNILLHIHDLKGFIDLMKRLSPENQVLLTEQFKTTVVKWVVLEETMERIIPYQDIFTEGVYFRQLYNQLHLLTNEKVCIHFIMSLAFEPENIARDLKLLVTTKSNIGFFSKHINIDSLSAKISAFPRPQLKKIHEALGLDFDGLGPDVLKTQLKDHLHELAGEPSVCKKVRVGIP